MTTHYYSDMKGKTVCGKQKTAKGSTRVTERVTCTACRRKLGLKVKGR